MHVVYFYISKAQNALKHILAPSAVACGILLLRASAHPRGAFLYRERSFLYYKKNSGAVCKTAPLYRLLYFIFSLI